MDDLLRPDAEHVLSVTELTRQIKRQLEGRFAQTWVRGEISNLRRQHSGHLYFSLKDSGSQLPCALFARDAARQTFALEDGMEVMLFGDISVYEPHGRYQLIAKIAIQSGEGRLQVEFERLKKKLAAEGLFDKALKQPLPTLPRRIAVITSPTGAAVKDFLRILKRRDYRGEVVIFPARVQGRDASAEVAAMLAHANASAGFDLIVITRGGGSIEDLWAFNEEPLARAVAASRLPVISAIGHEIDHVLTDFAADLRAETPSGAAELISSLFLNAAQRIDKAHEDLSALAKAHLRDQKQILADIHSRMRIIAPARQVAMLHMKLDELGNRLRIGIERRAGRESSRLQGLCDRLLSHHPRHKLALHRQDLLSASRRISQASRHALMLQNRTLSDYHKRLENSSLQSILRRGYAILETEDGRILPSAREANQETSLNARLHDGRIKLLRKH
jgi:exodeoxyribonuclease VII large subunit